MDKVNITEQDVLNAKAFIPLVLKYTLARYIAEFSTDKQKISVLENGEKSIPLPDITQRNTMRETQYKIGVFVKEYMGKDYDPVHDSKTNEPVPYLMAADEADAWSNFEAQLDRLKRSKDKAVADKCYDILNDYHAFVRMVSIEIEQVLQIENDLLGRMAWFLKSVVSETAADEIRTAIENLPKEKAEEEQPTENQEAEADGV